MIHHRQESGPAGSIDPVVSMHTAHRKQVFNGRSLVAPDQPGKGSPPSNHEEPGALIDLLDKPGFAAHSETGIAIIRKDNRIIMMLKPFPRNFFLIFEMI